MTLKLIQIVVAPFIDPYTRQRKHSLFGLDIEGNVYCYHFVSKKWTAISMETTEVEMSEPR